MNTRRTMVTRIDVTGCAFTHSSRVTMATTAMSSIIRSETELFQNLIQQIFAVLTPVLWLIYIAEHGLNLYRIGFGLEAQLLHCSVQITVPI